VGRLFSPAVYFFNPNALLPIASTFAQWAMLIFLGVKSGDPRLRRAFALFMAVISVWTGSLAMAMCCRDPAPARIVARLTIVALCFGAPSSLHFTRVLLRRPIGLFWPVSLGVAVATGALTLGSNKVVAGVWQPPWGGFYPQAGPWLLPTVAPAFLGVCIGVAFELVEARRARSLRRRQLIYTAASQGLGLLGAVDLLGVYGHASFPIVWATAALSTALILYSIAEHRLLGIRTVAHRSVVWALLSLGVIPPIYLAARAVGGLGFAHPLPTLAVLAALFVGTRLHLEWVAPRLAQWQGGPLRQALAELAGAFGERAVGARSPEEVKRLLAHTVRDGTRIQGSLLAVRDESGAWRTLPPLSGPPLGDNDPAIGWLALQEEAVTRDLLDLLPDDELTQAVLALLDRLGAQVLVPLRYAGELVGILALEEPRRAKRALDDEELQFLGRLAQTAGLALVNARLYDEVHRRSRGLEEQVRQRTDELARALEGLKHAQARLVHIERMSALGLLVAGVSHEINNALNFIYGNLPTLGKYVGVLDELGRAYAARLPDGGAAAMGDLADRARAARDEVPRLAEVIGEGARQARSIVEDLRRFARRDDEKEKQPVGIHEGLSSALNLLRGRLQGQIEVVRQFDERAATVEGHAMQLNQVWMAVLLNAAQAMQGQGRIEIATALEPPGFVTVTIRDSGAGIAPEHLPRVFEPFFTTHRPGEASGLGLTVARDVVTRHGGTIDMASELGKGATCKVILPVRRAGW
jgi:signal transduction histidine kinase